MLSVIYSERHAQRRLPNWTHQRDRKFADVLAKSSVCDGDADEQRRMVMMIADEHTSKQAIKCEGMM